MQGRVQLADELGGAIYRRELTVHYQPQFDIDSGTVSGVEALARWTLATGKVMSPASFIPLAERSGLIHELGASVLQSACEAALCWSGQSLQRVTLSVNVSALQINTDFCELLEEVLASTGFPPQRLEMEITESSLLGNTQRIIDYLMQWKRIGLQIAVDDFGTGYSSLSYLSRLPVDRLKMDRSLVRQMTLGGKSAVIARSIVVLGADLGIDVIAEGVETERQLRMLQDMGCPRAQGYLLARPMSAEQVQPVLRQCWGNRSRVTSPSAPVAIETYHAC